MPVNAAPGGKGKPQHPTKGKKPAHVKKQKPVSIYTQPPFDRRITSLPRPIAGEHAQFIQRGFMVWDKTSPFPQGYTPFHKGGKPAIVRFLFNPSTISTSYQIADGSAQAALNYGGSASGAQAALLIPLQQQTSFTIMFDRTYECSDPQQSADMRKFGVDMDVAAIRQYTGMYANVYAGNNNYFAFQSDNAIQQGSGKTSPFQNVNSPVGDLAQGIMQLTLGYVYFGKPGEGIAYYGYIDSWSVEYTHFAQGMTPMRCVVDISFTFLPPPQLANQKKTTASAQTIAQQQVAKAVDAASQIVKDITGIGGR